MNVTFYISALKPREVAIGKAFCDGAMRHGSPCRMLPTSDFILPDTSTDVAVVIGVKGHSRFIMESYMNVGKHAIIIDKGYFSGAGGPRSKYCRISVDSFQPLSYFQKNPRPHNRFLALNVDLKPRYTLGENVLIAGGSLKYAQWHQLPSIDGLDPATSWAQQVVHRVRTWTKRPIVYSPKPSWQDALPVKGAAFRRPPTHIQDELKHTWTTITFGSNAALDALLAGVPAFVLGDGIAKPLANTDLANIDNPFFPTDTQRLQWAADVAWNQWNLKEMSDGLAWEILRERL